MMSHRVAGAPLDFSALRSELAVPGDFSADVAAEAQAAAGAPVMTGPDRQDLPLVTIDPRGSKDLDQAMHLAADGDGYLVSYAIADVAAFVRPGGALDEETHRRGETYYFPDARVPLHPPVLSEGAASLLPGQTRPAALWQIHVGADGAIGAVDIARATVRSVAQLDYVGVQADLEAGRMHPSIALLPKIGEVLAARMRARHAIDLDLPEQDVEQVDGAWTVTLRTQSPVEKHNAQISLLTGMAAAAIMLKGGYGILRTVPTPDPGAVATIRRAARALGVDWPDGAEPSDVLAGLDRSNPKHVALIEHAAALLRGSGYTPFDGAPPKDSGHAGIGAPYAHVTAPLRRLVDRYGTEICLAQQAGQPVPDWVRQYLEQLPGAMAGADKLAHLVDRAVVDMTEAWLLQDRIGQTFPATVIDADEKAATIVVDQPAVRARCDGANLPVGQRITARLVSADVATRSVRFQVANATNGE